MASMWAMENALLATCYAIGAGATALGAVAGPTAAPSLTPARGNSRRTRRRGKHTHGSLGADTDDVLLDDGFSTSMGSTATHSTLRSDAFGSCYSMPQSMTPETSPHRPRSNLTHAAPVNMCPDDLQCGLLNDPAHYALWRHTCRLLICPSTRDEEHRRYFVHREDSEHDLYDSSPQQPGSSSTLVRPPALSGVSLRGRATSANFWSDASDSAPPSPPHAHLFHDSVEATPIVVSWTAPHSGESRSAIICGEWRRVTVHTLKQHLKQITGVPPARQLLRASLPAARLSGASMMMRGRGRTAPLPVEVVMIDDLAMVHAYLSLAAVTGPSSPRETDREHIESMPTVTVTFDEQRMELQIPHATPAKTESARRRRRHH